MFRLVLGISLVGLVGCRQDVESKLGVDPSLESGNPNLGDEDGDGYLTTEGDCDDNDATVHPGAIELCDGLDNDCNGVVDDGLSTVWYQDLDGDGYGDAGAAVDSCVQPAGFVEDSTDCNDADAAFHPGATEEDCSDPNDYNCDGSVGFADNDVDGYAACEECNDASASINPGAQEICDPNNVDEDCDALADDADDSVDPTTQVMVYADVDGDGYGDDATGILSCESGLTTGGDCNDADAAFHPGATEDCNDPNDYNCDGSVGYADADGDGVPACEECNDNDASISPNASEICDGIDNNCDGVVDDSGNLYYLDADGDGFGDVASVVSACTAPAGYVEDSTDCNDGDVLINPASAELCDGLDNNCDGQIDETGELVWYLDADLDGYGDASTGVVTCTQPANYIADGTDCDDFNADINPGMDEICNGVDDDCDGTVDVGAVDAGVWYTDGDGDGFGDDATVVADCTQPVGTVAFGGDCNDGDTAYNPAVLETDCTDPNDYNCDGQTGYADADNDGYAACEECDDTNAANYPGAPEYCDGVDNDCDGTPDEDDAVDAQTWYGDADSDGYGGTSITIVACTAPAGFVATNTDCDDTTALISPSAAELCDGLDNNCDGQVDNNAVDAAIWYYDADQDGYGDATVSVLSCERPTDYRDVAGDCNDQDADYNPGAVEDNCSDPNDYNCDRVTGYADSDQDGFAACEECDDNDAAINPAAAEMCDGLDNDCDTSVDESDALDALVWYADNDGDTYGDAGQSVTACSQPPGYVADSTDCDDGRATVNPSGGEICDGLDNDCDGSVDNGAVGATTWYLDADSDGYGDASSSVSSCSQPVGYVSDGTDCDDGITAINPGALEVCDGLDNNCDRVVDTDAVDRQTWYEDFDGDGYGNDAVAVVACEQTGYVTVGGDCNDLSAAYNPGANEACNDNRDLNCDGSVRYADADGDGYAACEECDDTNNAIYPGATEICNNIDDDCDGAVDDGAGGSTWYLDSDGDGYGSTSSVTACSQPTGYVTNSTDCDDSRATVSPAATEICDSLDNDCDGLTDESGASGAPTWYQDSDGDGYGGTTGLTVCNAPSGYVSTNTDCNDSNSGINPAAADICDSIDNNCDGTIDNGGYCPCNLHTYGTKSYLFCASGKTWSTAATTCESYGYILASVNDSAENIWLVDTAYTYYRGKWWTGGNDQAVEGTWTWRSGQTWSYSNWHSGEPNNSGNEDCMQLGRFVDYTWNDEPCGSSFYYVCESD